MNRTFAALRTRNYRLFATGSVVSNTGTWMQRVAQDWLILTLTGSAGALGLTTGLQFLPMVLFSPIAGVLADRFSKRRVLMFTQASMGVAAVVLGALAVTDTARPWHVYVLAFVFGTFTAIDAPARVSFVNEMVPNPLLTNAVALNSVSFNLARMIGPGIAGLVIALLGSGVRATGWVIMLNGLSYGAVMFSLKRMRSEELRPAPMIGRGKGQLRDGVRYVRSRPDIMLVMAVLFFAGTFGFNFQMTTALMATDVYHKGAGEYGLLGSILAVGSLAGALVAARRATSRQRLVILSAVVFGITEIIAGFMPTYVTFAIWLPVCGITSMTMMTAANSFVQMAADPAMRGRVMALYMAVFMGGTPFGAPLLGWIADHAGARWTMIGGGILTIAGTLLAVLIAARRQGLVITRYVRSVVHPTHRDMGPVVTD